MSYLNKIHCGDSLDIVSELPEKSIDLLITDPPYNISTDFKIDRDGIDGGKYSGADVSHDFGDWDKDEISVEDWLPLFDSCLKDNSTVIIFYDYLKMGDLIDVMKNLDWEIRQPVVWHKKNPIPQGYAVKWQEAVEIGMIATVNEGKGHNYQKGEGQRHNVIETGLCSGNERYEHPTQKPVELFKPIFRWWTDDNDVILDPFTGTGSICVAAKEMGLNYIGIEKQSKWVDVAQRRIEQTIPDEPEDDIFNY